MNPSILHVEIAQPDELDLFTQWRGLAADQGIMFRTVRLAGPDAGEAYARVLKSLHSVNAVVANTFTLGYDRQLLHALAERIEDGASLLVFVDDQLPVQQHVFDFLRSRGIEGTGLRAVMAADDTVHPGLIRIRRSSYADCFNDPTLFRGVDEVWTGGSGLVSCSGEAVPLLTVPHDPKSGVELIDGRTDFRASWVGPDPAFISASIPDRRGGRVMVAYSDLVVDPYRGPNNVWPGVSLNSHLAANILDWLVEDPALISRGRLTAYARFKGIESNLMRIVDLVLSQRESRWWTTLVGDDVRTKCEDRRRAEGSRLPPQSYLDLADLPKLIRRQRHFFAPLFGESSGGSKMGALKWLARLIEVRKKISHPARQVLGADPLTAADLQLLQECDERALALHRECFGS